MRKIRQSVRFLRDGSLVSIEDFAPRTTLLDYLRTVERSVGTKEGCAEGDCGACTVALGRLRNGRIAYEPVNACIVLLGQLDGAELLTIENLASDGHLHPVQSAMVENHGSQCGFCTPGIVMSLFALYQEGQRPVARPAVLDALAGNLCRCTGYRPIVTAALKACAAEPRDRFANQKNATTARLADLTDENDVFVGDAARFFAAPASEAALADLYAAHPDATLVGGCTDVGLWVTKSLAAIDKVIWLGRAAEMSSVDVLPHKVVVGATATLTQAYAALAAIDPDLGELMRRFGSPQVRAVGTVGGNLANGSPIGDLAPAMIALDSTIELRRGGDLREMPLERFFLAYRRQDRRDGEFVRRVLVPRLGANEVFRCFKVSKRFDEDISAVMGAFKLMLDGRRVAAARIAFGGMAGTPKRALQAEAALAGLSLDEASAWETAFTALAADYAPLSDQRASAAYRTLVARNLLKRALIEISSDGAIPTRLVGARNALEVTG
jgi:xanthine dehydrogenase small subunit